MSARFEGRKEERKKKGKRHVRDQPADERTPRSLLYWKRPLGRNTALKKKKKKSLARNHGDDNGLAVAVVETMESVDGSAWFLDGDRSPGDTSPLAQKAVLPSPAECLFALVVLSFYLASPDIESRFGAVSARTGAIASRRVGWGRRSRALCP